MMYAIQYITSAGTRVVRPLHTSDKAYADRELATFPSECNAKVITYLPIR